MILPAYGCVTIAFILAIVTQFVEVDATSLNVAGFFFIGLSLGSTFIGVILGLIRILQLGKELYQYIRDKCKRTHPNTTSETQLETDHALNGLPIQEKLARRNDIKTVRKSTLNFLHRFL